MGWYRLGSYDQIKHGKIGKKGERYKAGDYIYS